ncbi:hypothetical protein SKAU_G00247460 [Synaphobranchus kaupii]|uniref:Uncharacterized protein n=1 Tax=Synaphobranchus kaupii TaxID=118154 RepID=A0A9Q1F2B5_SYNKA|nr:hypothetical protein SKAU_G00247460 [Synaphobranchus kaupii]
MRISIFRKASLSHLPGPAGRAQPSPRERKGQQGHPPSPEAGGQGEVWRWGHLPPSPTSWDPDPRGGLTKATYGVCCNGAFGLPDGIGRVSLLRFGALSPPGPRAGETLPTVKGDLRHPDPAMADI